MARRPRLAVWKFASCDGCQLALLDCEDELLTLADQVDIAYFPEASSAPVRGRYDLSLVEGSISTPEDRERIHDVRRVTRQLVTIGACATAGGIQALRNVSNTAEYLAVVYARPDYIASLESSTPIEAHVDVDFELRGCPIDRRQLLEVIAAFLHGRRPEVPAHSVCVDCKRRGLPCLLVVDGAPCLGPVTHTGCGALCPAFGRPCFGCFGPAESAVTAPLADRLERLGTDRDDVVRLFSTFNSGDATFVREARR